jgi:glycerol-3-phosphate dehydrogenase (NAD(P)+)
MKTVTVLGAGVMGSAMALPLVDRGFDVRIVGTPLDCAIVESLKAKNFHPRLNVTLPKSVQTFSDDEYVTNDSDLILLGVASAGVTWAIEKLGAVFKTPIPILMITKGLSSDLRALPDVVSAALKTKLGFSVPVAAIAGPCIAGELAVRRPTGTMIVSHDFALALKLCDALQTDYYQPRASMDVVGAEICAAFKNFFAIAVGYAHGTQEKMAPTENKAFNNNAAAILFDQAIREMMILVKAFGGSPESVWGMPGAGDLYVTCQAGRNSRLGNHLGRGLTYAEVKAGPMQHDTVEGAELGIAVNKSIHALMAAGKLSAGTLPLTLALLETLIQNKPFNPPWRLMHA